MIHDWFCCCKQNDGHTAVSRLWYEQNSTVAAGQLLYNNRFLPIAFVDACSLAAQRKKTAMLASCAVKCSVSFVAGAEIPFTQALSLCLLAVRLFSSCAGQRQVGTSGMVAMEDQASRTARLRSLREAAGLDTGEHRSSVAAVDDVEMADPILKFRNYSVKDEKISHDKPAVANPPKYEQPVVEPDVNVEGEVSAAVI